VHRAQFNLLHAANRLHHDITTAPDRPTSGVVFGDFPGGRLVWGEAQRETDSRGLFRR